MKWPVLFIVLLIVTQGNTQDYEKMNHSDSLCRLIDADSAAVQFSFEDEILTTDQLPHAAHYSITVKGKKILKIERMCYYAGAEIQYGSYQWEQYYFKDTTLLDFIIKDDFLLLDTTIQNLEERLHSGEVVGPWMLHCFFYDGELVYYYSNGHGMTERDDFDAEIFSRESAIAVRSIVRKKYPELE